MNDIQATAIRLQIVSESDLIKKYNGLSDDIKLAVKAIESHIPKKPEKYLDETKRFYRYYCPVCGRYFGNDKMRDHRFLFEERYCQKENCGQAIDWSENHKD